MTPASPVSSLAAQTRMSTHTALVCTLSLKVFTPALASSPVSEVEVDLDSSTRPLSNTCKFELKYQGKDKDKTHLLHINLNLVDKDWGQLLL